VRAAERSSRHPSRHRLLAGVLAVGLLLGAAACSDDGDLPDDAAAEGSSGGDSDEAVLQGLAEDVIVPAYARLEDDLGALADDLSAHCAAPSPEGLGTARETWRTVARSWQLTRAGAVGPSMERRLMADVAFRARPDPVEDLLASDEPIDTESLRAKGSTFRGISLVEHLLFGADPDPRTCELLVAVVPISTDAVATVRADWEDGDTATFAEGPEGDPLASVDELANQVIACLTAIDDNGIRDLVLAETLDDALSTRRDGPGAYVMAEHRALLGSVAAVVDGGLGTLVEERSPDTAERLRRLTDEAVAAFEPRPDSADASYTDAHDQLVAASEAVAALKVLMTTEVASQLGITVRFSDADGDS
jgi:predicted lipoprotein